MFSFSRTLIFFIFVLTTRMLQAETVTAAVASNFAEPMRALAAQFELASGHTVKLAFASSGKIRAQIAHGAPYHVFFSADQSTVLALQEQNLVVHGSRFTYAIGRLALWSPLAETDPERRLKAGDYNRLAIANPRVAPYGQAAVEVLKQLRVDHAMQRPRVQGENVAQVYQFVASGNADFGFVALAQIHRDGRISHGSAWIVPHNYHAPIKQDAVLLVAGRRNAAAAELLEFMRSAQAIALIESFGYQTPVAP